MNQKQKPLRDILVSFFGNPVVGALGAIASIVGLVLAVVFYLDAREMPELTYYVHPVRTSVAKAGEATELSIRFKNQPIHGDVSAAQIALWNAGKKPILGSDILTPIEIRTAGAQPILEAKLRRVSRPLVGFEIDSGLLSQGVVRTSWRILENGDGAVIQLIYAGDQTVAMTAGGTVVGQHVLTEQKDRRGFQSAEERYARGVDVDRILGVLSTIIGGGLCVLAARYQIRKKEKGGKGVSYKPGSLFQIPPRVVFVLGAIYVAMGFWFLYRSWGIGPPFGF